MTGIQNMNYKFQTTQQTLFINNISKNRWQHQILKKKRIKIKIIELVKGKHEVIDELRNYIQENSFFRFILKTLVLVQ